jgi:UDP-GlcNAc3NAcA epimerase
MSDKPIRSVTIVGARPQFVKLAPVSRAMLRSETPVNDYLVHTGQHYDDAMSRVFFEELAIPEPSINLAIGSGSHGSQTGRMLEAIEAVLVKVRPVVVVVYGDTNSTAAGALAAAKLGIAVVHVEAGLRSFNRRMPEELNRIVTDHLSSLLCAPTATAMNNLANEGLEGRAKFTGDVMLDAVRYNARVARTRSTLSSRLGIKSGQYGVVTVHRAENTEPADIGRIVKLLADAAARNVPLVFPMHPRTSAAICKTMPEWKPDANLRIIDPLGYLDMLALVGDAKYIITDSGGLQKEAFILGIPCITLRDETEWQETVDAGGNRIVGSDGHGLIEAVHDIDVGSFAWSERLARDAGKPFGDGSAAESIVAAMVDLCRSLP